MSGTPSQRYRSLPPDLSPDQVENEVLERWKSEALFEKVTEAREAAEPYVFFEGPPTANGRPGIHHVFARTIKDLFCRYRTMKGYRVDRKAGWDTHGLPVEIEVEKALKISGKQQIEALGIEEFNRLCRESVFNYRGDWEKLSERIGFWLEYDQAYVTYTNNYIESVWWALHTLYERDLLYRGHKILPYCSRCGTALSSHEVAQGYEDVQDPSVYVAFELVDAATGALQGRRILVWTTTPWTLVSNVAAAVHPDLEYVEVRRAGTTDHTLILVAERCEAVLGDSFPAEWEEVQRHKGSDLAGLRYRRPLEWVAYPAEGEHEVIVAESFVSASDGTGVVHMAPAFGADDYAAGVRHGLAFLQPVDARGRFPEDMPLVGGKFVKDADTDITVELKRRGSLIKSGKLLHAYPHCWRCGTPLLYYARQSWFIRTTAFKDEMMERNSRVAWHPREIGEGRFGEWLKNNIDWAISRDRFWGTPLPIWICDRNADHLQSVGSFAQLAALSGATLGADFDPHKPFIDEYTWTCTDCASAGDNGVMRRAPQVIDTWFDSGSMPFAQWHYPFENQQDFQEHYPADFIAEGVDQTRGWFYSLLAIATGLGDALPRNSQAPGGAPTVAPYRSVVVNDLVLDAAGQKMSKSRGNAVDPWLAIPAHGADAVRLFLVASSQVWVPRRFDEGAIRETAGRFLLTLKNVYSGIFAEYANFGWAPSSADPLVGDRPLLDQWVLSRLAAVEEEVDRHLALYDATLAVRAVLEFVDEDVSKWYVRASRRRFYDVDGPDNRAAFATLHEVLVVVSRLLAPFAPFVTDWIHRELTGESVHLASFTRGEGQVRLLELEAAMNDVRVLSRLGRAAREEAGIKVRQPLSRMVCVTPGGAASDFLELTGLLREELNVKRIELVSSGEGIISLAAKPNFRNLGKRFGKNTPQAAAAVSSLSENAILEFEIGGKIAIVVEGVEHFLEAGDFDVVRRASGSLAISADAGYVAAIDPYISPELRSEGIMREIISRVQRLRKETGLAVSDRITLWVTGEMEAEEVVRNHSGHVAGEVLALVVNVGVPIPADRNAMQVVDLDGLSVTIAISKEA